MVKMKNHKAVLKEKFKKRRGKLTIVSFCMTRNKMRVAIESGKGMKVKVVKLC